MSRYFAWLKDDPKPYDYTFSKRKDGSYLFKLNNIIICILYKSKIRSRISWSCVVWDQVHEDVPKLVNGFSTRHYAIEYALKTHSLTKKRYNK